MMHQVNSAARDYLLRFTRSDTMTVVYLYKAELLQSSHEQESKNKEQKSVNKWMRTEMKMRT